ncbi:MAG: hypothetical protein PF961_04250 [Planctomycetota bacterium]|jgi:hypothetical protein|nr:hypothetical protein [Planctomycetota bacterium]
MIRSCLLIAGAVLALAAAEGPQLPRGVERALSSYEKAAAKAQEAYDEAMADAVAEAVKDLTKEQEKATKAGSLDLALAIRAKIDELTPVPEDGADLAGGGKGRVRQSRVSIPAAGESSLGELPAGVKLSIAYDSGLWGFGGSMGSTVKSPDDPSAPDALQVALVYPSGTVTPIGTGTASLPFVVAIKEAGEYRLRMRDAKPHDNVGEVVYRVGVR